MWFVVRPGTWSDHGWASRRAKWCVLCRQSPQSSCPNSQSRMEPTLRSSGSCTTPETPAESGNQRGTNGWPCFAKVSIIFNHVQSSLFNFGAFEDWSGLDWDKLSELQAFHQGWAITRHLSPCKLPACNSCFAIFAVSVVQRLPKSQTPTTVLPFFAVYRYDITYIHPYPSHPRHTLVKESRVGVWWDISRLRFWHSEVDARARHGHAWPVNWTTSRSFASSLCFW